MTRASRLAWLLCLPALAGCEARQPLHGRWVVDLPATVEQARRDGITAQAVPQIREVYAGGRIEITPDAVVMRVDGLPDAIARNYRVLGEQDGCYRMAISGAPGAHAYCVRGQRLLVHDPSTPLTVVFQRES
ncbi:MAG TPA: hypothetical protein VD865_02455 [Stenotrophomonas sp.]|nr:hypothetical protein [Stenotrophomonas sp.]